MKFLRFQDVPNNQLMLLLLLSNQNHTATLRSETTGCLQPSAVLECKDSRKRGNCQRKVEKSFEERKTAPRKWVLVVICDYFIYLCRNLLVV